MIKLTEHKPRSRAWRITIGILSIFFPIQETTWYLRSSREITKKNLERINTLLNEIQIDAARTNEMNNPPADQPLVSVTEGQSDASAQGAQNITLDNIDGNYDSQCWQASVDATGKTVEELEKVYIFKRRIWRIIFWVMALIFPLFTTSPLMFGHSITSQQLITGLVLFSGIGVAWSRALIATFRLWQLRNMRVSTAEQGTFRHFLTENDAVRRAIYGD